MDRKKFLNLLKKSEGTKLDFKQSIEIETDSGRKELAKDICAIANSRGGRGYLIIGIEDKTKRIVGIENHAFSEEKIQQIVSSRIEPPIPVSLEFMDYDNKKIAIISIYDGPQKPYQIKDNGAFYIRRGSTNDTMRKQEIVSALQENLSLNIELFPIPGSNLKCIDNEIVDRYFCSQGIEVSDDNRVELMENASIIHMDKDSGRYMATLGGLLIFSRKNNVYISHNMIKITNRTSKSSNEIIIIQGDLLSMMDESEEILQRILPKTYPIDSIYEGVRNAVLYRDYTMYYKEIEIIIDFNSVAIISPGILLKGKNQNSINYMRRNMWIYEKIITLDKKGRFGKNGTGFNRIQKAFKNKGRINFINAIKDGEFKVIYPGVKKFK
ncbi:ATP-binding protein [Clostridium sp. P21]|uniref:ATP-binding protein n=1 Tax=Clostridium muellerianum TaxID=2716538 RepID=A0A7Y0HQR4_9CLOT|nr:RNA-binding domain-containing protein [Clostridium muellerianum]NMM65385.1 ATP-binding protein [Clostridium muellerianum]